MHTLLPQIYLKSSCIPPKKALHAEAGIIIYHTYAHMCIVLCIINHLPFLFDDDEDGGDDGYITIKCMKVIFVSTFLWKVHAHILLHMCTPQILLHECANKHIYALNCCDPNIYCICTFSAHYSGISLIWTSIICMGYLACSPLIEMKFGLGKTQGRSLKVAAYSVPLGW